METIYALVAKTEKLNYVMVLALHIPETIFIGIKTGKDNGNSLADSIALCMTYGFLWWMPVKHKLAQK